MGFKATGLYQTIIDSLVDDVKAAVEALLAASDDEQHESNDGEDHQDRPQHGGDSTLRGGTAFMSPANPLYDLRIANKGATEIHRFRGSTAETVTGCQLCGKPYSDPVHSIHEIRFDEITYNVVTPEIQAVLDALPEWVRVSIDERPRSDGEIYHRTLMHDRFMGAVRAYLASIEPPKPSVESVGRVDDTHIKFAMTDGVVVVLDVSDPYNVVVASRRRQGPQGDD